MTCDIQDNVVGLDLSDNNLRGSVPTEVGDLTALTSWALPTNLVTGALPSELGGLQALKVLLERRGLLELKGLLVRKELRVLRLQPAGVGARRAAGGEGGWPAAGFRHHVMSFSPNASLQSFNPIVLTPSTTTNRKLSSQTRPKCSNKIHQCSDIERYILYYA